MQARSQSQRKMPPKARSFTMLDLFNSSFSRSFRGSSNKLSNYSNHARDEQNVFCADFVSTEFIIDNLKKVRNNNDVVNMEIEDLLTSSHHSLLPFIKALLISGKREWQSVRFVDDVESDLFALWQTQKQTIMQDYEESIDDCSKYKDIVSFNANIHVAQGTPYYVLRDILQCLRQSKDKTIAKVTFEGSFVGIDTSLLPSMIKKIIDPATGKTKEEIIISVESGWSKCSALDWKMTLNACLRQLQQPMDAATASAIPTETVGAQTLNPHLQKASTSKAPLRRVRTSEGPHGMKRKHSLRRLKSVNDSSSPTGPQRSVSLPLQKREAQQDIGGSANMSKPTVERKSRRQRLSSNQKAPKQPKDMSSKLGCTDSPSSSSKAHLFSGSAESPDYDWKIGVYLNNNDHQNTIGRLVYTSTVYAPKAA
ncbi:expressed unknown protein [Seminavis robusta]|uniref:Uncharacterized protein n=1 Tax=Seminavis robusta TaxID=568900 RepID=A0A9N8H8S3_9STRA|nr:expressed unknown protein [Seminavis robusta]|eukprot:Sro250_g098950.1 n/a (424) ;mRNA; f:22427-23784